MTPLEFLRDYLSKWGPDMDEEEYDGMSQCLDALNKALAAVEALRSYQYGNSSPELAQEIADALEVALKRKIAADQ